MPDEPHAPPDQPANPQSLATRALELLRHPYTLFAAIAIAVTIGFIFYMIGAPDGTLLGLLQKTEIARGLITFLIAIATVVIALVLALYPIISGADAGDVKERFGLGKEVLTTLIGVLGTIVGFYFGSADRPGGMLELAEIRVADAQVLTHASGGTAPYRFTIRSGPKAIENRVSEDGWIIESLGERPTSTIDVEVTDSKNQRVTKKHVIAGATTTPNPAPTPTPEK